jgi:hypothetical protein
LMAADPETMPHFRQSTAFDGFNREHGRRGHYCRGFGRGLYSRLNSQKFLRSRYGVVGREAVADDAALMVVVKSITQRLRPTDVGHAETMQTPFSKASNPRSARAPASVRARADELFRGHGVSTVTASIDGFPTWHTV